MQEPQYGNKPLEFPLRCGSQQTVQPPLQCRRGVTFWTVNLYTGQFHPKYPTQSRWKRNQLAASHSPD